MIERDFTKGSIFNNLIIFSLPYLLSCFLQTFYGLADLFLAGQFNGASTITAVSVGSQVMHMITVIIAGLSMGITVNIGHFIGADKRELINKVIGNSIVLFLVFSVILTVVGIVFCDNIVIMLSTPNEAVKETRLYLEICFIGIILICAYNVIAAIFRGYGNSKLPLIFVAISGVMNIILDCVFMGVMGMGALGAAIATVIAQGCSVIFAIVYSLLKTDMLKLNKSDICVNWDIIRRISKVGVPVAAQDGFIQVSFLVITIIANSRGVQMAAAVGIVEKLICFMFLVPSSILASISAIVSHNVGNGNHRRAALTLKYGLIICTVSGIFFITICELFPYNIINIFSDTDSAVVEYGVQYLRAYVTDCVFAGIHFCFSGYFCAYDKSYLSFIHNAVSIIFIRIPGSYLASVLFADTLFPMGMAAPIGSILSGVICVIMFIMMRRKMKIAL